MADSICERVDETPERQCTCNEGVTEAGTDLPCLLNFFLGNLRANQHCVSAEAGNTVLYLGVKL